MHEPEAFLTFLTRMGEPEATGARRQALYATWRTWDAPEAPSLPERTFVDTLRQTLRPAAR